MLILTILPLLATAVSASSNQIPLGREPNINNWAAESEIDVSPFVFTSLQGLLRQWQNVFAPTGHTIIPGTVPAHTLLYHARRDMETPPSPEWFAFDIEMSYGIIAPFGVCIMNTYAATRPLNILYFDGMSAALGRNGTLDSQNVFLYGKVVDDDWGHRPAGDDKHNETRPGGPGSPGAPGGPLYGEYKRAKELCDWANSLGGGLVEGFVRMNSGFELLWCDFNSSAIELVSRLNVTIPAPGTTFTFEFEESAEIDLGDHPHHCPPPKHEGDHHKNPPSEHERDCQNPPKGDHSPPNKDRPPPDCHHGPPRGEHPPPKDGERPDCHHGPPKGEYPPPKDGNNPPKGDHPPLGCHHAHHPPPSHDHPPKDGRRPPRGDHPHHPPPDCHNPHHPHHPPPHKNWRYVILRFLRRFFSHHPPPDCHHGHPGHPPNDGHGERPPCKGEKPHHGGHSPPGCHRPPPKHCPHPPKDDCPPPEGDRPPHYEEPPNGSYPHFPHDPRQHSPFSTESRWEWVRSATWHYNLAPESRVILDYCRMTSYYNVSIPGRTPAGTPNAKRLHRLGNITLEQANLVKKEIEHNLLSYQEGDPYCSGVDWRETVDGITRRYFGRIIELRGLLSKAQHIFRHKSQGPVVAKVIKRIRGLSHAMAMPFFQLRDQDIEAAQKRCVKDYTGRVDLDRIGNSERILVDAVEGVMENVCKAVFGVYGDFTISVNEDVVKKWSEEVEALVGWIDWAGWHRCNDACGWDEVCAIPLWPILGTPWNQGADDELLFNPKCIGIEFMESGNGGWGPGRPPG